MTDSTPTRLLLTVALGFLTAGSATGAEILYVDADRPAGGDGLGWETAFQHLQDALAAADADPQVNEVRVAQGTYVTDRSDAVPRGSGDRTVSFEMLEGVGVRGGYAGFGEADPDARDHQVFQSVLTADIGTGEDPADNAYHVVRVPFNTEDVAIDGFVIRDGNADGGQPDAVEGGGIRASSGVTVLISNCRLEQCSAVEGGGLYVSGSGVTVEDCHFEQNDAITGGAVDSHVGTVYRRCTFLNNSATDGGAVAGTATAFFDCLFDGNSAVSDGGANASGGTFVGCRFVNNSAGGFGGAVVSVNGVTMINCELMNNTAGLRGGGLRQTFGDLRMLNCLAAGNVSTHGGAVAIGSAVPSAEFRSCTFVDNEATQSGGGIDCFSDAPVLVVSSILWGNNDASGDGQSAQLDLCTPTVVHSLVQGLDDLPGPGNLDADPAFVDGAGADGDPATVIDNDYRLSAGSPAVDAGHNWSPMRDEWDLDDDADETELTPLDLDGSPRFVDDPVSEQDAGCGVPYVVDIGAYERPSGPGVDPVLFADLDGDQAVGVLDLVQVILDWGVDGQNCLSDLDLDGVVGVGDLVALILEWS